MHNYDWDITVDVHMQLPHLSYISVRRNNAVRKYVFTPGRANWLERWIETHKYGGMSLNVQDIDKMRTGKHFISFKHVWRHESRTEDAIVDLIAAGKKIDALKRIRKMYRLGLTEALEHYNALCDAHALREYRHVKTSWKR